MSYSRNISGRVTAGNVSSAKRNTTRRLGVYKIAISGDAAERIRVLTQIIAMRSVLFVTKIGEAMDEKVISNSRKNNLAKKVIKTSKSARSSIEKKTIN